MVVQNKEQYCVMMFHSAIGLAVEDTWSALTPTDKVETSGINDAGLPPPGQV